MAFTKHSISPSVRRTDKDVRKDSGQTKEARAKSQRKYGSKPSQIKRRSERNKTRRLLEKRGLVRKGDGKDVDHQNGITSDVSTANLRVVPKSVNRRANRR